ncbi:MAG: FkbM family methyltransferase [Algoriphagus sp.]|nr:FkbM family methyltransferase [Algoriphagus sp.]
MKLKELIYRSLGYRLQILSSKFKSFDIQRDFGRMIIRKDDSDIRVFKQIFLDEVYYFFPQDFSPKVILDAGANVGYSTVWFASKFPNAEILAIEPEKSNFDVLKKNTQGRSNIFPIQAGLWFEKSFLKIHDSKSGSWAFETRVPKDGENTDVESVTIQELIRNYKLTQIDLLKIDIEGAEYELFDNQAEEWLPFVNMIMIETHDRMRPGCSELIDRVTKPFGFRKFITRELSIYCKL